MSVNNRTTKSTNLKNKRHTNANSNKKAGNGVTSRSESRSAIKKNNKHKVTYRKKGNQRKTPNSINVLNTTTNLHKKKRRVKKKYSPLIFWALIILILFVIITCVVAENQRIAKEQQEEQKRIEQQMRQEEEERIRQEEQNRKDYLAKLPELEFNAVYNLETLNLPSKILDMATIDQYPELPAGCECMALTNQLNYYGFILDKFYLVKNYLPCSDYDFIYSFYGDPYDYINGGVIMAPGVKSMANQFLEDKLSQFRCFNVSGRDFKELYAYIERGNPVQIWTSLNMSDLGQVFSTNGNFKFFENSHCVVLEGFNRQENMVYINDSINGHCKYKASIVEDIYKKQNYQALVIVSQEERDGWINNNSEASYKP